MRYMMFVKGSKKTEAGVLPTERADGGHGEVQRRAAEGRGAARPLGAEADLPGVKVQFSGGKRTVIDGPFTEAKEIICGYWIIQVKSREEAIEWAKRIPAEAVEMAEVELRPFFELEDFAPGPALEAGKELGKKLPAGASSGPGTHKG